MSFLELAATYSEPRPVPSTAVGDVAAAAFRNRRGILVAILVFLTLVALAVALRSPTYASHMLFLVRSEGSAFPVTSFRDTGGLQGSTVSDAQIGTEVELLSGTDLHRKVIADLHPGLTPASIDSQILTFDRHLKILPVPKSELISVTFTANSPEEANATLAALSREYLNYRAHIHGSDGAYSFFDREASEYYQKLQDDQAKLADFETQNQVTLLAEEKNLAVHNLSEARSSLYEAQASAAETGQKIGKMEAERNALQPRVVTQERQIPNQTAAEHLGSLLVDLQNKRLDLLTKFHATDRHVQEVDEQIANTKEELRRVESQKATEDQSDVNPVRQSVETDLEQEEFKQAGLRARQRSLASEVSSYESKLQTLDALTAEHDDLASRIQQDQDNYDLYSKRREEARIDRTLDQDKVANVRQVAGPTVRPISRFEVALAIGCICMLGMLFIVGAGVLMGLWSPMFHTPWEVEAATGSLVLATIPMLRREFGREKGHKSVLGLASNLDQNLLVSENGAQSSRSQHRWLPGSSRDNLVAALPGHAAGFERECVTAGGAYFPLAARLDKIGSSQPGGAVFAFTACRRGEGVTQVVENLGEQLRSLTGKSVAVVSAPEDCLGIGGPVHAAQPRLNAASSEPGEAFLKRWFQGLREMHDYILIDCPSLTVSRLAVALGLHSDGVIMVVGAAQTTRGQLRGALASMSLASAPVLGLVLNRRSYPIPESIYKLV